MLRFVLLALMLFTSVQGAVVSKDSAPGTVAKSSPAVTSKNPTQAAISKGSTPAAMFKNNAPGQAKGSTPNGNGVETRTLDQIYKAAQAEKGSLRIGWGGDIQVSGDRIVKAFETRFPGIKLDLKVDVSKYIDSRVDLAIANTKGADTAYDVVMLQTLHDYPRWKQGGHLMHYKVPTWNDIHPEFVDPDGAYTGYAIFSLGDIAYKTSAFPDNSTVPVHILDFLKPEYQGKIGLTYPNDDDSILYLFTRIIGKYGWDFFNKLVANQKPQWYRGTSTPALVMTSGNAATSSSGPTVSFASSSVYVPTVGKMLTQDVYMAWPQTGAIFSSTKMPETAKLFMSWLLSDEWQTIVTGSKFATRKSFDKAKIMEQENVDPFGFMDFMADRETVEGWRFQFESLIGLPQGPDPLSLKF
ncbi:hypothetical protein JR316_0010854 [Psilocybe cubensis]|uniref:Uncharacterized protein n=2 Tax=Psilocybe cubensis TaxID=181762 RepID=A0ACB8GN19_PSICU|nr:hypothetical protein JR316_0010854 [Psilocybe cubensis]KAH9476938.1 hypothetical protein JR316_0010854 [Psilocybe cubensis]